METTKLSGKLQGNSTEQSLIVFHDAFYCMGCESMYLLSDSEKVHFLIDLLDDHMKELADEDPLRNYIESLQCFLKTRDPIVQKAAASNSVLFIDNLAHRNTGTEDLISYYERYLAELETELKDESQNEFLKGKIKGIKHALVIARMIRQGNRHKGDGISIIID